MRHDHPVAIVTGAAGGIGRVIAAAFAAHRYRLMLGDIREDEVAKVASEISAAVGEARSRLVDITSASSIADMVEATSAQFGGVDVLVHAAGLDAPRANVWDLDDALWDKIIEVNLTSAWKCAKAVLPGMVIKKAGRIIFISSIASWRASPTTAVAYNAAKAGINGLTIGLAKQLEPYGILVNAIAPGPTGTGEPMTAAEINADRKLFPIPIVGAQPIADACLYLAGPSGAWISGTTLNISGGRWHG
jgi:NAD(P)-dependent dehydrogenase (short-subunit alcohol dehydrogenase family)